MSDFASQVSEKDHNEVSDFVPFEVSDFAKSVSENVLFSSSYDYYPAVVLLLLPLLLLPSGASATPTTTQWCFCYSLPSYYPALLLLPSAACCYDPVVPASTE